MTRLLRPLIELVTRDDLLVRVVIAFFGIAFCGLGYVPLAWIAAGGLQGEPAWLLALAWVLALAPTTYGLLLLFRAVRTARLPFDRLADHLGPAGEGQLLILLLLPAVIVVLLLRVFGIRAPNKT